MVPGTSALVAVLFDEPERDEFIRRIAVASRRLISVGTLIESSIVVDPGAARSPVVSSICSSIVQTYRPWP